MIDNKPLFKVFGRMWYTDDLVWYGFIAIPGVASVLLIVMSLYVQGG